MTYNVFGGMLNLTQLQLQPQLGEIKSSVTKNKHLWLRPVTSVSFSSDVNT